MKRGIIALVIIVVVGIATFLLGSYLTWHGNERIISDLKVELENEKQKTPLEDRFADLMDSLSDNGTMKYDVDIQARLLSDGFTPDEVSITLRLEKGDYVGGP